MATERPVYTQLWRREFGDEYAVPDVFTHDARLTDISWHNDACPSFALAAADFDNDVPRIWVDHIDPDQRENGHHTPRFLVTPADSDDEPLYVGADAEAALAAFFAHEQKTLDEIRDVETTLNRLGFNIWQTGGGCTAYGRARQESEGAYVHTLITVQDDLLAPTLLAQRVTVGRARYDANDNLVEDVNAPAPITGQLREIIALEQDTLAALDDVLTRALSVIEELDDADEHAELIQELRARTRE